MPPVINAFFRAPGEAGGAGMKEAPLACLIATSLTAAGCVLLFLFPDTLVDLIQTIDLGVG